MDVESELPSLVRRHLRSVWALEILLLMRGRPEHVWSVQEVVGELRATPGLVADTLEKLQRSGLVAADQDDFRYSPASPLLSSFCEALERAYRERPVALINLISTPDDQLHKLAAAFKFGGDGR